MRLPRDTSGRELIRLLCRQFGYTQVNQTGSHVILETDTPNKQRICVPDHKVLRVGTLNAILRSVAEHKGIARNDIITRL